MLLAQPFQTGFMRRFAETAEAISGSRSRLAKIRTLSEYLRNLPEPDLRAAAIFFTGRPFPLFDGRTLNVGGAMLTRAIQQISHSDDRAIHQAYLARPDLGEVAESLLPEAVDSQVLPSEVFSVFETLAVTSGASAKLEAVTALLSRLHPTEAKYVIKIVTGELRIGLKESTVEEAIAAAFDRPADAVRRANMSLGDIGETAIIARNGNLDQTGLRLFRPVKFMLATPAESEAEIRNTLSGAMIVEDKYDGIRGQLHIEPPRSAIYSRTLDEISHQFPEIAQSAEEFARISNISLIADGEIVAFRDGQILPFALLQQRLGRKKPSDKLLAEIPVSILIFDLLYVEGRTLIDDPLEERKTRLTQLNWSGNLRIAPFLLVDNETPLDPLFDASAQRRNEGLMLKDPLSPYSPGKRGMSWLKWKKALATLDVVVTGVEFGHGRRRNVLSDYTFAVQHEGKLLNIGKAYSGLTDREILELTDYFKSHTLVDHGWFREVQPLLVLEVTFNGIQKSSRHNSGFALRFPRIVRVRSDKKVEDIDTLEGVARIFETQQGPLRDAV